MNDANTEQLRRIYHRARIYAMRHSEGPDRDSLRQAYVAGALSMKDEIPLPARLVMERVGCDDESTTIKLFQREGAS